MELSRTEPFLDYLGSIHARTRRAVMCIPSDDLEWSPAAGKFSFGGIVRHLAAIERWMYAEAAHGPPGRYPGHGRELAEGFDAVLAYHRLTPQKAAQDLVLECRMVLPPASRRCSPSSSGRGSTAAAIAGALLAVLLVLWFALPRSVALRRLAGGTRATT